MTDIQFSIKNNSSVKIKATLKKNFFNLLDNYFTMNIF